MGKNLQGLLQELFVGKGATLGPSPVAFHETFMLVPYALSSPSLSGLC